MTSKIIYHLILLASFPFALVTFITLLFVTVPYGRYERRGWGPTISNRLGWILMESPSAILFFTLFLVGSAPKTLTAFFFLMWEAHYVHRSFIYPFRIPDAKKSMPMIIFFDRYTLQYWKCLYQRELFV